MNKKEQLREGFEFLQPLWNAGYTLPYREMYNAYYLAEEDMYIAQDGKIFDLQNYERMLQGESPEPNVFNIIPLTIEQYIQNQLEPRLYQSKVCDSIELKSNTVIAVGEPIKDLKSNQLEDGRYYLCINVQDGVITNVGGRK